MGFCWLFQRKCAMMFLNTQVTSRPPADCIVSYCDEIKRWNKCLQILFKFRASVSRIPEIATTKMKWLHNESEMIWRYFERLWIANLSSELIEKNSNLQREYFHEILKGLFYFLGVNLHQSIADSNSDSNSKHRLIQMKISITDSLPFRKQMISELFKNKSDSKNIMIFQYHEYISDLNIPSQDNRQLDWSNWTHSHLSASSKGFRHSVVCILMILRISGNCDNEREHWDFVYERNSQTGNLFHMWVSQSYLKKF
jgi:hypothetical protein